VNETATIWWDDSANSIRYIDQTILPNDYSIIECMTIERLVTAINRLEIRGAPALGVAGAYGIALAAQVCQKTDLRDFLKEVYRDAESLRSTRPTAINLGWGIDRVLDTIRSCQDVASARIVALAEARDVARDDTACCHMIGDYGAALLPATCTVLTHCNAGSLACSSWGTALGVIRSAVSTGKLVKVIACETRPLLQGARLTAWELLQDGIDVTVITDSTAAHLMRTGKVDAVIVGADRITCDAVFNKIGTYMHAVCAHHHNIPFYVAAPLSTFDTKKRERDVTLEERGREEVATMGNRTYVPDGCKVRNFAFDATPLDLVTAIITESGVLQPPFNTDLLLSLKSTK
jgi:methylthioribose-1-phosphate isomerase